MHLDRARWSRMEMLFEQAQAMPGADRPAFLQKACGTDESLYAEVLAMLTMDDDGHALSIERLVAGAEPAAAADPLIGAVLGAWRVVEMIGRGGAGIVYLAERADGQYQQRAALKLVGPGPRTPEAVERFRAERRILARLTHPNISRLIDGGFTPEGTPYLVMEYVDGVPLTTYCDQRGLTIDDRLRLFQVVCQAVQHAHRALIVHRDLKPSNIYVSSTGEVKLLDFGVAKLVDPEAVLDTPVTRAEHRVLTPAYAAPEQLRGEPVTTSADVYSLGVVLYELVAGRRPFSTDGLSSREFEDIVASVEAPPPSAVTGGQAVKRLRGDLDRICLMALRKEPERRYASAEQLSEEIARFLDGRPVLAQPATVAYRTRRFIARNRAGVAVVASFAILVLVFSVVAAVQARLVTAERDRVRVERDKAQEVVQVLVDLFQTTNPQVVPGGDRLTTGEFLTRAEPRVLAALDARPEIKAAMKHVLGQVHAARSDYARARSLLEQAVADSRRLYGDSDVAALAMQIDLAALLLQIGERAPARALLQTTLERTQQAVGERHALTARCLTVLAQTYDGDPVSSKPLLERALTIRRGLLRPDDLQIAETLDTLASAEMTAERLTEARALFDEAMRIVNANNGGRNVRAVYVTTHLGALLLRLGDYAGAETLHRRSAELAGDLIGPDSFEVADATNDVAVALAFQGKLDASVDMLREAYRQHVALMGETHWRTANAARNIALALLLLERPAEAKPWMEKALQAFSVAEGENTIGTAYFRAHYAYVLEALGRRDEAITMLEAALQQIEELAPPEGEYRLADTHLLLGRALLGAGRPGAAEPHMRHTVAFRRRVQPAGHPQRATAECHLARALAALGRDAEARDLLDGCVPRIENYGLTEPSFRREVVMLRNRLRTR
jgi:eukaryotic-like serine/threonine-protein kinase